MIPARRRTVQAVALSLAAHAVVLTALALHAPTLNIPPPRPTLPEPIIPLLIVPRPPPPPHGGPPPEPIRLHRRPQPFARHFPTPPLPVPEAPAPARPPPANSRVRVTPEPEVSAAQLRGALRTGAAGCANPDLLSDAERERCLQALGAGARITPYRGPAFSGDKQQVFDRAAASKQAYQRYRRAQPTPSRAGGALGTTASDMVEAMGGAPRR